MDVLVTGGSRGIGFAIAEELARHGHRLAIVGKNQGHLAAAGKSIGEALSLTITADLADPQSPKLIGDALRSNSFSTAVLVLSAGAFHEEKLLEASQAHIDEQMRVNLLSQIALIQEVRDDLIARAGRVIIIGSTAAFEPYAYGPVYGITKWALRGLAENLRAELRPHKVGVTLLHPGGTWTDLWSGADLPRERLLEPSDIARLVATILELSPQAVVDELIVRPIEGDMHD